jgi:large subunit ribosomal protein L7e
MKSGKGKKVGSKKSKKTSGKKKTSSKSSKKTRSSGKKVVQKAAPVQAPVPAGPYVPESTLKKQQTQQVIAAKRATARAASIKAARAARAVAFRNARKYAAEYANAEKQVIRLKRQAKNNGSFFKAEEPRVLLVVRMRGINRMAPKTKKILQLFRLRQIHNAVFVKVNKATLNMLRLVEPYVTYGPPTIKTVRHLVYKRGFGKVEKQRIPLSSNKTIVQNLGSKGISCIEDLIHEVFTVGENFKEANNFLWPFKLSSPLGGYNDKGTHFSEGGDAGNRGELINAFVARMN